MARFPSIDNTGAFEAPEVQNNIKQLVTGSTDGITVDTSVGTRVYVGDTMIHGDTGWRDFTEYLTDEWSTDINAPAFRYRRENSIVTVQLRLNKFGDALSNTSEIATGLPIGFRAQPYVNIPSAVQDDTYGESTLVLTSRTTNSVLDVRGKILSDGDRLVATATYFTPDQWPTSLPGLPS